MFLYIGQIFKKMGGKMSGFIPTVPDDAVHDLPAGIEYTCEPAALRLLKDNLPAGNLKAWDGHGTEIVWRLMVAAKQRGRWVAVNATKLISEIMVEGTRPQGERLAYDYFYVRNDQPGTSLRFFRDALLKLEEKGFIGRDGDLIWLLPYAVERCQVPAHWSDDKLLQF